MPQRCRSFAWIVSLAAQEHLTLGSGAAVPLLVFLDRVDESAQAWHAQKTGVL
jgi:hypothetical protein